MKKAQTAAEATFSPQEHKTFSGALCAFLEEEFPQMAGKTTRLFLANTINKMVEQFYPKTTNLKPGQTTWITVFSLPRGGMRFTKEVSAILLMDVSMWRKTI